MFVGTGAAISIGAWFVSAWVFCDAKLENENGAAGEVGPTGEWGFRPSPDCGCVPDVVPAYRVRFFAVGHQECGIANGID
jgi:hypothetical protein